jgi:bifunctional DNase/RNase
MIEVKVFSLAYDEKNQYPVVVLQSIEGGRRLPIWIGAQEANAIAMEIAGKRFQRPLTHDLVISILKGFAISVPRVEITDLRENTFYAKIYLDLNGQIVAVDARPSDSLALALKSNARIFVNPKLFSDELDRLVQVSPDDGELQVSEEERVQRVKAYLENLNPKDFGRFTF